MATATLTSKGQVTIPKAVRDLLKLHAGDQHDFVVEKNGQVKLVPATLDVTALKGILHRPGMRPMTLDDMDHGIKTHLRKTFRS